MIKIFRNFKKNYLQKIVAFIILEIFILTYVPIGLFPVDRNTNKNDNKSIVEKVKNLVFDRLNSIETDQVKMPIILSYSVDLNENALYMSWNIDNDLEQKYYIFKKDKKSSQYKLVTTEEGLGINFYVTNYTENIGSEFVVAKIKELPDWIKNKGIFSNIKLRPIINYFNKDEKIHFLSNTVRIDKKSLNSPLKPILVDYTNNGNKTHISWKSKQKNIKRYLVYRKNNISNCYQYTLDTKFNDESSIDDEVKTYYVWAFDDNGNASTPLIYTQNTNEDGFYSLNKLDNKNKDTVIEYKEITLNIPKGSVFPDSYITITPINIGQLKNTLSNAPNITKTVNTNYAGYEITLNGDTSARFLNDIEVTLAYDESKIPKYASESNAFIYYYDEGLGKWKYIKRTNLDKGNNTITASTNHFCQFYVGAMTIQSEPPQAKGINTDPINIQKVDSMAGIKGIEAPSPNNTGTANVNYPITVPEGINGMTPHINISYSSSGGHGDCGYGWNIMDDKIEIDTKNGIPIYNGNDALLLNGQELVNISGGVYRIKKETSFSKIVKSGSMFIVYEIDGTKKYYGENDNSRLYKPGEPSKIFRWNLTRVVDKFGNQINYEYQAIIEGGNRVNLYLLKIIYGYNGIYTLNFIWENRPDIRTSYRSRFRINNNQRLKNVIIKYNTIELKREELVYNVLNNISILKVVKELVGTEVINEQEFVYETYKSEGMNNSFNSSPSWNGLTYLGSQPNRQIFVDVNGDGLVDWIHISGAGGGIVHLNNGNGGFNAGSSWNGLTYLGSKPEHQKFTDVNGDGLVDWIHISGAGGGIVHLNNGNGGFNSGPSWSGLQYLGSKPENQKFIDANGDGLVDWIHISGAGGGIVHLNNGNGGFNSSPSWNGLTHFGSAPSRQKFHDVNGDGLVDWIHISTGVVLHLNNGNGGFNTVHSWVGLQYLGSTPERQRFTDVNGDGLVDWIHISGAGGGIVHLNNGNGGFNAGSSWNGLTYLGSQPNRQKFVDVNGDGLVDWIHISGAGGGIIHMDNPPSFDLIPNINALSRIINKKTNTFINLEYRYNFIKNYNSIFTLSSITTGNDDLSITTNISYEDGVYDRIQKKFRGFTNIKTEVYDSDQQVTHITETTYKTNESTGTDDKGRTIYDQYINGQVDIITKSYLHDGETIPKILSKQKTEYEKVDVLTGFDDIKFVYPKNTISWLYDFEGNFIGIDETNGDIAAESNYTFDYTNGLITGSTQINYSDPYNTDDDVRNIVNYTSNISQWVNIPYKTESIDIENNTRIALKTSFYDNQAEGIITNGLLTKEESWNNNGSDPVISYEYDSYGNIDKIITGTVLVPNNLETNIQTNYISDNNYYMEAIKTLPTGLTESIKTDIYGRTVESINVYGDLTKTYYDNYSRVISIEETINDILTTTKQFTYSKEGDYFKAEAKYLDNMDTNGFIKVQFYKDGLGRDIQTKTEGVVDGNKVWIISGKTIFDDMGRVIETGSVTTGDFNTPGYVDTSMISPVTYYSYDYLGRESSKIIPTGTDIRTTYDKYVENNRILSKTAIASYDDTNTLLNEKIVHTDMLGNNVRTEKLKSIGGDYAVVEFEYDLHGYGKLIESPDNPSIRKEGEKQLDSIGRVMWVKTPDAGKTECSYNDLGLAIEVKEYGRSEVDYRTINYTYDSLNRITDIDYPGTEYDIDYEYYGIDASVPKYAKSNIKKIDKGNYFSITYNFGQLWIEEQKTIEATLYNTKYEYDVQGRINTVTYPDNEEVNYIYDEGGFLTSIVGNNVYIEEIRYDKFGQRNYLKYGNGSEMTYQYDPTTRLLDIFTTKDISGNEILKYDYNFNKSGFIESITDNAEGTTKSVQNYTYDFLERLVSADGNWAGSATTPASSYNRTYNYDDQNRMTSRTLEGVTHSYNYVENTHAVSNINISTGNTIEFDYDDYGNMIKKEILAGATPLETNNYLYDESNRLKTVDDGIIQLDFLYDNRGQRIKKVFEDELSVVKETTYVNGFYTVSDGRIDKHISDGNYIVASLIDNDYNNIKYYHSNHIGSTAALTDKDGNKFQEYLYYPYGETWIKDNNPDNSDITRLFTGQEFDQESGLYYMNARYYDPDIGIFMRPDPAMQGTNHYEYAKCNPIMYNDPTGLEAGGSSETVKIPYMETEYYYVTIFEEVIKTRIVEVYNEETEEYEEVEEEYTEILEKKEQRQRTKIDYNTMQVWISSGNDLSGSNSESRVSYFQKNLSRPSIDYSNVIMGSDRDKSQNDGGDIKPTVFTQHQIDTKFKEIYPNYEDGENSSTCCLTDITNAISFEYTKKTNKALTLNEHVPTILNALKDAGKLPSDAKMTGFSKIANIAWESVGMKEGEWFNGSWVKEKEGSHSLYKISRNSAVGGYHWLWKSPAKTNFYDSYNNNYINNPTPVEDHYLWLKY